jgi:type IV secretory pathway TrbL component
MSTTLILLIAALIVTFLVFTWLIKVAKATLQTALTIAVIVLILQLVFGIGPTQLWQQITEIPQLIWQQKPK